MPKLNSGRDPRSTLATSADVHAVLGNLDDATLMAILNLSPTVADVEAASFWANGQLELLPAGQRLPEGAVARIFDILTADENEQQLIVH